MKARTDRIKEFGVGAFSDEELADKCSVIKDSWQKPAESEPMISVVIPAFKEEQYILATLLSLSEQTHQNFEVVVVSNGEERGNPTEIIAQECGVRSIHEPKKGVGRARQVGLDAARGEIIAGTDADTLQSVYWLSAIQETFRNELIVAAHGPIDNAPQKWTRRLFRHGLDLMRKIAKRPDSISEANTSYRRKEALEVGGYNTDLELGEGRPLLNKLAQLGIVKKVTDEEMLVYPSSRREDKGCLLEVVARQVVISSHNLRKGRFSDMNKKYYPDIR